MNTKTRKIIGIILIVIIIIIISIYLCKYFSRNKESSKNNDKSKSSHSDKLEILNSWKNKSKNWTNTDNKKDFFSDPDMELSNVNSKEKINEDLIIAHPKLQSIRDSIFRVKIEDIQLITDITKDSDYKTIRDSILSHEKNFDLDSKATLEDKIKFLLKYKKYMSRSDVYSISGPKEINQIYTLMLNIISNKVDGDLIETGAWKGGISMWMKAIYNHFHKFRKGGSKHLGSVDEIKRKLWLFDVFDTFPEPSPINGKVNDKDLISHEISKVMYEPVDVLEVRKTFARFGLLDENVRIVKGNMNKTIPASISFNKENSNSSIDKISLLRIDCDYYDSVYISLIYLYPKIQKGGYVLIDDYNNPIVGCKQAVDDFRKEYNIKEKIIDTYGGPVYWSVT